MIRVEWIDDGYDCIVVFIVTHTTQNTSLLLMNSSIMYIEYNRNEHTVFSYKCSTVE